MTVFIRGNTFVFPSLTVFYFNTRYGFQSCYNKQSVTIFPSVFKGAYPHSLVRILLLQRNGIAWYLEKAQPSYIKRRSLTGRKGVASQALFHLLSGCSASGLRASRTRWQAIVDTLP